MKFRWSSKRTVRTWTLCSHSWYARHTTLTVPCLPVNWFYSLVHSLKILPTPLMSLRRYFHKKTASRLCVRCSLCLFFLLLLSSSIFQIHIIRLPHDAIPFLLSVFVCFFHVYEVVGSPNPVGLAKVRVYFPTYPCPHHLTNEALKPLITGQRSGSSNP